MDHLLKVKSFLVILNPFCRGFSLIPHHGNLNARNMLPSASLRMWPHWFCHQFYSSKTQFLQFDFEWESGLFLCTQISQISHKGDGRIFQIYKILWLFQLRNKFNKSYSSFLFLLFSAHRPSFLVRFIPVISRHNCAATLQLIEPRLGRPGKVDGISNWLHHSIAPWGYNPYFTSESIIHHQCCLKSVYLPSPALGGKCWHVLVADLRTEACQLYKLTN